MANNIDKIKNQLKSIDKPNWFDEYNKRTFMNRPDAEILFAAQEYVWSQINLKPSLKKYESLKLEWSDKFKLLGADFPEYPYK
ncbi:hypothetical protein [Pedobacter sp. UYP30]|uniref:hypothetical protein n=1 Tax=Pedobacter sp. UYP30 TaxID=1756400 RepID=UPI00339486B8